VRTTQRRKSTSGRWRNRVQIYWKERKVVVGKRNFVGDLWKHQGSGFHIIPIADSIAAGDEGHAEREEDYAEGNED
jgi:hypothetical protein